MRVVLAGEHPLLGVLRWALKDANHDVIDLVREPEGPREIALADFGETIRYVPSCVIWAPAWPTETSVEEGADALAHAVVARHLSSIAFRYHARYVGFRPRVMWPNVPSVAALYAKALAEVDVGRGAKVGHLRIFDVYGPDIASGVVASFRSQAQVGQIEVVGTGAQVVDLVDQDDACRMIVGALESEALYAGDTFDIGTGRGTRVIDLARWFADRYSAEIIHRTHREGEGVEHPVAENFYVVPAIPDDIREAVCG